MIPTEYKGEVMAALANIESAFDGDEELKFVAERYEFNYIKLGAQIMAEQLIEGLEDDEVRSLIVSGIAKGVLSDMLKTLSDYQERERRGEL